MDFIHVYDNSVWGGAPTVILQAESAEIIYLAEEVPAWLKGVLEQI